MGRFSSWKPEAFTGPITALCSERRYRGSNRASLTWTYDAAGNRLTQGGTQAVSYTYNAATQRLTSSSGAVAESFTYDNVGQLTADGRGTYGYSPLGKLTAAAGPGVSAAYAYDAAGGRLAKTVNGHTTYTVRSAAGDTLSEYTAACGAPVWSRDVITALGRPIGAVHTTLTMPVVSVSATTASVAEAAGSLSVSFTLATPGGAALGCAVTASYHTTPGTASAGTDYGEKTGTVTFAAGSPNGATQTISVPILQDVRDEADETFFVDLGGASGAAIGANGRTTVTIVDDDPTPTLSISDVAVTEGQSGTVVATFTVGLSAVSGQSVQVAYATANDTAVAGSDYAAASGTLTIPAGSSTVTVPIAVFGDVLSEINERFTVTLSSPVHATLARSVGYGLILNDDSPRHTWGDFVSPLDGAADAGLFDPATKIWTFRDTQTGYLATIGPFADVAAYGDILVPGDYDGDGRTDAAFYRPTTLTWSIRLSTTQSVVTATWGSAGAVPTPGDYDGDGKTDVAYFLPSTGWWYIVRSSTGTGYGVAWGGVAVVPTPADFDGDGKTDVAYYVPSSGYWYIVRSSTGIGYAVSWGIPGATVQPVAADYDGDGHADVAFYYPAGQTWYLVPSTTGTASYVSWGLGTTEVAVPADYDGDGKTDVAFYNPGDRFFYIVPSTTGVARYTGMSDVSPATAVPILKRPQ